MGTPKYYESDRAEMLRFVPQRSTKVLDVGCGEGYFGERLIQRQQAEVWGVEPFEAAATIASQRLFKVLNSAFDDSIQLPEGYFDCIVFNDVLEHMVNPGHALQLSKRFLANSDSVVVASIPNFRYWENMLEIIIDKKFTYKDQGILDKTHLRFFTKDSIYDLFNKSGFDIIDISGINSTRARKFRFLNILLQNQIDDMRHLQFGVVAKYR